MDGLHARGGERLPRPRAGGAHPGAAGAGGRALSGAAPRAAPSLDALAASIGEALGAAAFPAEERGGVFRPGDGRPVRRLGLALEPGPTLGAWAAAERLDALFLHRPWRLAADALPAAVGVVWSHLPFDERVTTGYNPALAAALGMGRLEPLGARDGRPLGMLGAWAPRPAGAAAGAVAAEFGGRDDALTPAAPGWADRPVARVAVVGAMTDALVREAAARGAGLYVTGQLRQPGRAAALELGLPVLAVGHARSEWWGVRALARLVTGRWPGVRVAVAPSESRTDARP